MGCGASSKGAGGKYSAEHPKAGDQQSWAVPPPEPRSIASPKAAASTPHASGKTPPSSASSRGSADGRTGSYRRNKAASPPSCSGRVPVQRPSHPDQATTTHNSQSWEVQEVDKEEPASALQSTSRQQAAVMQDAATAEEIGWDTCTWWADCAEWIYRRSAEVLAAYNFFFEHICLRKGWRVAPFSKDEVQAPFRAAAEVVVVVRARLDSERGEGIVLRQVEGSAMNFLWGWSPTCPPGSNMQAAQEFLRGLVFATLSDAKGLVEGLDSQTVEGYVCSHPFLSKAAAAYVTASVSSAAAPQTESVVERAAGSAPTSGENTSLR